METPDPTTPGVGPLEPIIPFPATSNVQLGRQLQSNTFPALQKALAPGCGVGRQGTLGLLTASQRDWRNLPRGHPERGQGQSPGQAAKGFTLDCTLSPLLCLRDGSGLGCPHTQSMTQPLQTIRASTCARLSLRILERETVMEEKRGQPRWSASLSPTTHPKPALGPSIQALFLLLVFVFCYFLVLFFILILQHEG